MLQSLATKVAQITKKNYSDYNDSLTVLIKKIEKELSRQLNKSFKKDSDFLIIDAHSFLHQIKPDIERWLEMQRNNLLTISDIEFLISDKIEISKMSACEYINLDSAEIDKIKSYMLEIINNTLRNELTS